MPYPDLAPLLWKRGWHGVLPLPKGRKSPVPDGWSGHRGAWPSWADVVAWIDHPDRPAVGNTAIRLPEGIVGLDIDHYDGKTGGDTFADRVKRWGEPPPTWRITSRSDGVSGILLYRGPAGRQWLNLPDVDLLTTYHRYAVAPGSVHPSGEVYRLYDPEGLPVPPVDMPSPDELPALPPTWVENLSADRHPDDKTDVDVQAYLAGFPGVDGEPCEAMSTALQEYLGPPSGSRYDRMVAFVMRIVRLAEQSHPGGTRTLLRVRDHYVPDVADRAGIEVATGEFIRATADAVKVVAAEPSWRPETDKCVLRYDAEHWPTVEELMRGLPGTDRQNGSGRGAERGPDGSPAGAADGGSTGSTGGAATEPGDVAKSAGRPLALVRLSEFLDQKDPPERYLIDRLLPAGGNALLVAQFKAGKSTAVANLARSLVDGTPFLDEFEVKPFAGSVVIIDDELSEAQFRRVLRAQGIVDAERVHVISLRGRVAEFDLLDPAVLSRWVGMLRGVDCKVLIFDCLRPVLDALGLSEDKDAGRFLVQFDRLVLEADVNASTVVHHMGHSGERGRGDSRLRDWPDVEWKIVRPLSRDDNGREVDDPSGPRYFSAFGREIEVAEGALEFDPLTKHLTYSGVSRKESGGQPFVIPVLQYLKQKGSPASKSELEVQIAAGKHRNAIREAVRSAQNQGLIGGSGGPGLSAKLVLTQFGHTYLATSPHLAGTSPAGSQEPRRLVSIGDEARSGGGVAGHAPAGFESQLPLPLPDEQPAGETGGADGAINQPEGK